MTDIASRLTHFTNLTIQKKHFEFNARKEEVVIPMASLRDNLVTRGICKGALDFKTRVRDKINEIMRLVFL